MIPAGIHSLARRACIGSLPSRAQPIGEALYSFGSANQRTAVAVTTPTDATRTTWAGFHRVGGSGWGLNAGVAPRAVGKADSEMRPSIASTRGSMRRPWRGDADGSLVGSVSTHVLILENFIVTPPVG
jgi:hypothetical protein